MSWRRVLIEGTCSADEVAKLRQALQFNISTGENFHCLATNAGIGGLPQWAAEKIHAVGNLAERGFTAQDVAAQLLKLAEICPSLLLKVHCGADDEGDACESTVTLAFGKVQIGIPEVETIPMADMAQMLNNMQRFLILSGQV
jgi:hypothetical protein